MRNGLFIFFIAWVGAACALSRPLRTQVEEDIRFAGTLRGLDATPLHRKIFGDAALDGTLYQKYLREHVREFLAEGIGSAGCGGAVACTQGDGRVRITENYSRLPMPPVSRLSLLIHEARHAGGWPHVPCPDSMRVKKPYSGGSVAGEDACDRSGLGAYGVQYVMLKNIARYCRTCDERTHSEADRYAEFVLSLILDPSAKELLIQDAKN